MLVYSQFPLEARSLHFTPIWVKTRPLVPSGCLLPPAADMPSHGLGAAMCQLLTRAPQQTASLFDHLVGAGEQRRRHVEAERLGGLEIDD